MSERDDPPDVETTDSEVEDLTRNADYDAQADLALPHTAHDSQTPDDGFVPGIGSVAPDPGPDAGYDLDRDVGA